MSSPNPSPHEKRVALLAVLYAFALFVLWGAAWLLSLWLEQNGILPGQPFDRFLYWLVMRILFWVLPSLALIRYSGRSVREVLGFDKIRGILLWGGITGLVWGGKAFFYRLIVHQAVHAVVWDWSFVTAVVYAPFVEELAYRGAIMGSLQTRMSFPLANLLNGLLFLLIHLPGWYFQGVFSQTAGVYASMGLGVLLLGWIFGFVAHKSQSVAASTLTHMLNNLFQRFMN